VSIGRITDYKGIGETLEKGKLKDGAKHNQAI